MFLTGCSVWCSPIKLSLNINMHAFFTSFCKQWNEKIWYCCFKKVPKSSWIYFKYFIDMCQCEVTSSSGSRLPMNRKAEWVYLSTTWINVCLLSCFPTVVYGTSWIRQRMGSDREWQFIPSSPLTDMSHSLMTLLCLLSLHLICVSVKSKQPKPPPPDSKANTHPFNDITFGVMPFSVELILSSICIIQAVTQPQLGPIKSWSFPHPFPLWWQMSRWKLAIIYCSHALSQTDMMSHFTPSCQLMHQNLLFCDILCRTVLLVHFVSCFYYWGYF